MSYDLANSGNMPNTRFSPRGIAVTGLVWISIIVFGSEWGYFKGLDHSMAQEFSNGAYGQRIWPEQLVPKYAAPQVPITEGSVSNLKDIQNATLGVCRVLIRTSNG